MSEFESELDPFFSGFDFSAPDLFQTSLNNTPAFHFFPQFPIEVRLKVWALLFPPRRNIDIRLGIAGTRCENPWRFTIGNRTKCPCFNTWIPHPITLYINSESRTETLKYYRVLRRRCVNFPEKECQALVVRFGYDIPFLTTGSGWELGHLSSQIQDFYVLNATALDTIRTIEIRCWQPKSFDLKNPNDVALFDVFRLLPGLKEVRVILREDFEYIGAVGMEIQQRDHYEPGPGNWYINSDGERVSDEENVLECWRRIWGNEELKVAFKSPGWDEIKQEREELVEDGAMKRVPWSEIVHEGVPGEGDWNPVMREMEESVRALKLSTLRALPRNHPSNSATSNDG